jgi:hypothetical protein
VSDVPNHCTQHSTLVVFTLSNAMLGSGCFSCDDTIPPAKQPLSLFMLDTSSLACFQNSTSSMTITMGLNGTTGVLSKGGIRVQFALSEEQDEEHGAVHVGSLSEDKQRLMRVGNVAGRVTLVRGAEDSLPTPAKRAKTRPSSNTPERTLESISNGGVTGRGNNHTHERNASSPASAPINDQPTVEAQRASLLAQYEEYREEVTKIQERFIMMRKFLLSDSSSKLIQSVIQDYNQSKPRLLELQALGEKVRIALQGLL